MLVQPGKYKRDANLGRERERAAVLSLHPHSPSITQAEQVCACIIGTSHRPPPFSFFSGLFRACRSMHSLLDHFSLSLSGGAHRLRGRFNLPRRECVDTRKYSPATRSPHARMTNGGIVVEGLVKGETGARVRREIGRGWWDYVFFPPSPSLSVRGFPLRRVRPFFLGVLDPALA